MVGFTNLLIHRFHRLKHPAPRVPECGGIIGGALEITVVEEFQPAQSLTVATDSAEDLTCHLTIWIKPLGPFRKFDPFDRKGREILFLPRSDTPLDPDVFLLALQFLPQFLDRDLQDGVQTCRRLRNVANLSRSGGDGIGGNTDRQFLAVCVVDIPTGRGLLKLGPILALGNPLQLWIAREMEIKATIHERRKAHEE